MLPSVTANADNGGIHHWAWWEETSQPMWGFKDTPLFDPESLPCLRTFESGGRAGPQAGKWIGT